MVLMASQMVNEVEERQARGKQTSTLPSSTSFSICAMPSVPHATTCPIFLNPCSKRVTCNCGLGRVRWTTAEDNLVLQLKQAGTGFDDIAITLNHEFHKGVLLRNGNAVRARLGKRLMPNTEKALANKRAKPNTVINFPVPLSPRPPAPQSPPRSPVQGCTPGDDAWIDDAWEFFKSPPRTQPTPSCSTPSAYFA